MAFPANIIELEAQGYIRTNEASCRGCCAPILWYVTPNGSKLCMDPMPELDTPAISHWTTCPEREKFRKPRKTAAPADTQSTLF
jgi:hypothetical protein